jgi:hypothetical protein
MKTGQRIFVFRNLQVLQLTLGPGFKPDCQTKTA